MSHGVLRCIGPLAMLKETYGQGYNLYFTFSPEKKDSVTQFVASIMPEDRYHLTHSFAHVQQYVFEPVGTELADLFERLRLEGKRQGILHYGLSESTLDEIFTQLITLEDASSE
jgi:hypothetical protein